MTLRLAAKCLEAQIIACEIDSVLAEDGKENLIRAGHCGRVQFLPIPAERLLVDLNREGLGQADYIISSVRLACLRREKVSALLESISLALRDTGLSIQFQHSLIDRKNIRSFFRGMPMVPNAHGAGPAELPARGGLLRAERGLLRIGDSERRSGFLVGVRF